MKLYDIVKDSTFKISRNKRDVIKCLYSVIWKLTGKYLSTTNYDKYNCDLMYKLVQKYSQRKVNKDKFLEVEQEWLHNQEVNI